MLASAAAWLECQLEDVIPIGDSDCLVGRPLAVGRCPDAAALVHHRGRFHGLSGALAPTPWFSPGPDQLAASW